MMRDVAWSHRVILELFCLRSRMKKIHTIHTYIRQEFKIRYTEYEYQCCLPICRSLAMCINIFLLSDILMVRTHRVARRGLSWDFDREIIFFSILFLNIFTSLWSRRESWSFFIALLMTRVRLLSSVFMSCLIIMIRWLILKMDKQQKPRDEN